MANPLRSLPLEGFRQFQTQRFVRNAQSLNAQAQARLLLNQGEFDRGQLEQRRQESLGIHERIGSFLDTAPVLGGVKQGGLTALGVAGSILGAPGRALPGGLLAVQEGRNFFEGAAEGFMDRRPDVNYASVLEGFGMEHEWGRRILGFGLDMLADPLNVFMIPSVAAKAGVVAGRLGAQASRVPGVTRAVTEVQRPFAIAFSPRIGLGQQEGKTYWHIKQMEKSGEIAAGGADAWINADRTFRNYRRNAHVLATHEAVQGLKLQRIKDLMEDGADEAAAKLQAEKFVDAIRTNEDLQRELSQTFRRLRATVSRTKGVSWEFAEEAAEKIGLDAASLPGAMSVVRFLKVLYGKENPGNFRYNVDPTEMGVLAGMKDSMGVTLTNDFYMPTLYGSSLREPMAASASLQQRALASSKQLKDLSDPFIANQLDDNVLLAIANDIATTRLTYYAHQMIDDNLLSKLGTKATLTDAQLVTRKGELGARFSKRALAEMAALHDQGVPIAEIANQYGRKITVGGEEQFAGPMIRDVPGGAQVSLLDDELIRQVLENRAPKGFERYDPNPQHLYIKPDEIDEMVDVGLLPQTSPRTAYIMPTEVAESFTKYAEPMKMASWLRTLDTLNGFWKPWVTVMPWNISFFSRNAAGLAEMVALAGMRGDEAAIYGFRAAKFMKEGIANNAEAVPINLNAEGVARWAERGVEPLVEMPRMDLYREWAENGGIMVGQREVAPLDVFTGKKPGFLERARAKFTGQPLSAGLHKAERMRQLLAEYGQGVYKRHGFNPIALGTSWNEGMDNTARVAIMLWRMDKGDTAAEAARVAAKYIGNYTELGRFTAEFAPVVPFIRWARHSTPLQAEGLIRRPYVGSKTGLARGDEADQERLEAEVETLPDWILERHHILMGKDEDGRMRMLTGLGLPIEDLNRLFALNPSNTFKNAMAEITPFLRAPLERLLDQSFFTGDPISNKEKAWNYYNRAWGWTAKVPLLRNWLELEQLESRDGRTFYRANPMSMFVFASIISRPGFEADRIGRIAEERDGMLAINFLTGAKFRRIFPESPSRVDFPQVLNQNPAVRGVWQELQNIPLYPQFHDAGISQQASRAINKINAYKRSMEAVMDREVDFLEAADAYAELDQEGAGLAIMVKQNRWKQDGRRERDAFRKANPILTLLQAQLSAEDYQIIFDLATQP
jgi:hypothetical protein